MNFLPQRARFVFGPMLLLGGSLLLNGCGGGGGGTSVPVPTATPAPTGPPGLLLDDEFNASSLDANRWSLQTSSAFIQRTQLGNRPTFAQDSDGTKYVQLPLNTFLPGRAAGSPSDVTLFGTEFGTNVRYPMGTGLKFEARMRLPNVSQQGIVNAFFLFSAKDNYGSTPPLNIDEIDHELLNKAYAQKSPYTWTNIYNNFVVAQPDGKGGTTGGAYGDSNTTKGEAINLVANYNPSNWNVYRVDWQPGSVKWYVNDVLRRTDTTGRVPDEPLGVRFNIWGAKDPATGGWDAAYSDTLQPAPSADQNQTFNLDVDWVHVNTLDGKAPVQSAALVRSVPNSNPVPMAGYSDNK